MKADQKDIKEHSDYLISTRRHKGNAKHSTWKNITPYNNNERISFLCFCSPV